MFTRTVPTLPPDLRVGDVITTDPTNAYGGPVAILESLDGPFGPNGLYAAQFRVAQSGAPFPWVLSPSWPVHVVPDKVGIPVTVLSGTYDRRP